MQSKISDQLRDNPVANYLMQPILLSTGTAQSQSYIVQLYWKSEHANWSEGNSLSTSGRLGVDRQEISFKLPPSDVQINQLRFDPADKAGFFRIHDITITPAKHDETTENKKIWGINGNENIAKATTLVNVEYCKNGLGDLFISTGNDPYILIDIPHHVKEWMMSSGFIFTTQMDWPKSTDYLVVMDSLGKRVVQQKAEIERLKLLEKTSQEQTVKISHQAERISQQAARLKETSDQVRSKEIYIDNIEKEIEAMRNTQAWKLAESFRKIFYYRLIEAKTLTRKSITVLREQGFAQFVKKIKQHFSTTPESDVLGLNRKDYNFWIEHNRLTDYDIEEIKSTLLGFQRKPLISILVPVYNVDQEWLERTIDSVRQQLYENWELCLCDDLSPLPHVRRVLQQYSELDSRIKILFKEENDGISKTSNAALAMATGEYVGLLDHDDELSIDALYENVKAINANPDVGLIYSDEDKLDMQGNRCDPFFKPDYSPELLKSQNYICHFTVIKKSIMNDIGGFKEEYDGSQDHDLILRALEKAKNVHHIPKILYHWRKIPGSTAAIYDSKSYAWEAGRKAIEDSLHRNNLNGEVVFARYQGSYRARYQVHDTPLVSIIIPFKDKPDLLKNVINSILEKSTYTNYEIVGVSNNSTDKSTFDLMENLSKNDSRISFIRYNHPFNFSAINNHAITKVKGKYVVLLNNDIEIISPEWIEAMLEFAQQEQVGAVGGKLYYSDDRIQHTGIVIGMAGIAGPPHHLFQKDD
ncbi:MAG: glycosyltransferase, partial [Bacteroidetes bacterium]|nr:glycosyltransferase [Bacteroidota bacterium]